MWIGHVDDRKTDFEDRSQHVIRALNGGPHEKEPETNF